MELLLVIIFALLGGAIGSFMNVVIDRVPAGKSLVYPPSHCGACGLRLTPADLVPVISYILLRGRCRHCHSGIPQRVFWVEILGAAIFALGYWHFGVSAEFGILVYYCCLFLVLGVIDLEKGIIPNRITYPSAGIALIISSFFSQIGPGNAAIGGAVGLGSLLLVTIISRGGMGWGDVKLAALIGIATGFPLVIVSLLIGVFMGGMVAILLVLLRKKKWRESVPFGPFLSMAAVATLIWGNDILNWYLGLF